MNEDKKLWKKIDLCDICSESNVDGFHTSNCCGLKWCCRCDVQFYGLCPICKREELNNPGCCYNCDKDITFMSSKMCRWCQEIYCVECLFANDTYCNYNHECKNRDCKISGYLDFVYEMLECNPRDCWCEHECEYGEKLINEVIEETLDDIISQIEI